RCPLRPGPRRRRAPAARRAGAARPRGPAGRGPGTHLAAVLRRPLHARARRPRRRRVRSEARTILGLAIASQASLSVVQWGLAALGPDLASHYGMSAAALGALLSAAAVGNALTLVVAGGLIDRQGVRLPLVIGGIGCGAALALGALAPNAWLLGLA